MHKKTKNFYRIPFLILALSLTAILAAACGSGAKADYKAGMKLYEDQNYEEAQKKFEEATVKNPDKAEYYIVNGMALVELGRYDEACAQFDKAVSDRDNQIVRENNKQAWRGKGISYYENRDYQKAADAFEKALAIKEENQMNLDLLFYKADAELQSGNYEKALASYEEILKERKNDGDIYGKKAQAEAFLGDTENARKDYEKAIELESGNYDLYFGKYFLLLEQGAEEAAEEVLEKALEIKTKEDSDYFNVAKIHFFQGQYDKAQAGLSDAAAKGFSEAAYYLGQICEEQGDLTGAIANYETYLKSEPDLKTAAVHNQLGLCCMQTGDYEKALAAFQAGAALNDSALMKEVRRNEIAALERLADYQQAYEKVKSYLAAYPEDEEMKRESEFIRSRTDDKNKKAAKGKTK